MNAEEILKKANYDAKALRISMGKAYVNDISKVYYPNCRYKRAGGFGSQK